MNKLVSLLIKVGMGVLLLIGVILIWVNLSIDTSGEEPILKQEFFKETYDLPVEYGKKAATESIVRYDYVVDNQEGRILDMTNNSVYEMDAFVSSKGKTKTKAGTFKNEEVDLVLLNSYNLQKATGNSVSYTYWLMWGGLILIAGFSVFNIIQNPKRFIPSAIGFSILALITFICYKVVDSKAAEGSKVLQLDQYTDASFHWTAMGITLFITLAIIAGVLILAGFVIGGLRYLSK
jgi:hypothetical protein